MKFNFLKHFKLSLSVKVYVFIVCQNSEMGIHRRLVRPPKYWLIDCDDLELKFGLKLIC